MGYGSQRNCRSKNIEIMPIFTPSHRWQKAYYPFKYRTLSERIEESFERTLKGVVWGCRMCGNCLLQETAFICPMACPKGIRNGPCGGSTPDHCCVGESRPCIWYAIFQRAERLGRLERLLEIFPPLDWDKTGTSALRDVVEKIPKRDKWKSIAVLIRSTSDERKLKWDQFFEDIRQPAWWTKNTQMNSSTAQYPASRLEQKLSAGSFVVTYEYLPPLNGEISSFDSDLQKIKILVDAVNITDGASSIPRIAPIVIAQRALELGIEPIMHMTARDRTRLSFQSDLLGASATGVHNLLLITGDHPNKGKKPFSKMDVWDFDSIQALWMARKLRDEGKFLDGRQLETRPYFFLGAAAAPFASNPDYQAIRLEKKIHAGAQYFQTNMVFDIPKFEQYLEALDKRSLLKKVKLITGVTQIKSLKNANYLNNLPGVTIPQGILKRFSASKDFQKESHQICLETIDKLISMSGIHGIHFMAIKHVDDLKGLIIDSALNQHDR